MVSTRRLISALAIPPLAIALAVFAWLVTASVTFVYAAGIAGKIGNRMWNAWWLYATHNPDLWTKILLTGSALAPLTVLVLALVLWWRFQRAVILPRKQQQSLFGDARFANNGAMQANQIHTIRSFRDA